MKENLIDVLMFLFENYFYDEPEAMPDQDSLQASLVEAGFAPAEINKAFRWLEELADQRHRPALPVQSKARFRVFSFDEAARLDTDSRGLLMFLGDTGILDSHHMELVMDRVMALENDEVDIEDLKWIVLMVLFNQPGQEEAYAWMENLVYDGVVDCTH